LETLRQYGVERLETSGERSALAGRHLAHYVDVAQRARGLVQGDGYERGAGLFEREWDNLRAALSWAVQTADPAAASTLVVAPFWYAFLVQRHELGAFAEQALRLSGVSSTVHGVAAFFAFQAGAMERADRHAQAGIAAPFPTHPDTVICWQAAASCDAHRGRNDDLRDDIRSYAEAARGLIDAYSAAAQYALAALFPSASDEAARYVAEAKRLGTGLVDPNLAVLIGVADGIVTFAAGRRGEAAALLGEARRQAERAGPYPRAIVAWVIALRAAAPGFDVDPRSAYHEAITLLHELREWANLWLTVESLAAWWADTGRLEQAAMALGHLDATGRRFMDLADRRARAMAAVRAHRQSRFWLTAGARADRDELIEYVLNELDKTGDHMPDSPADPVASHRGRSKNTT
jgi:hypothetical protein